MPPLDINGCPVEVGTTVRLLSLSGQWLDDLPADERDDVQSMIGEAFTVEEIDEHGHPWVRKSWPNEAEGRCHSHSIALEPHEMVVVQILSSVSLCSLQETPVSKVSTPLGPSGSGRAAQCCARPN